MTTINLREYQFLLPEYIILRNRYVSELLTSPITLESTVDWISARPSKGLVYGVLNGDTLIGAFSVSFE